MFSLKNGLNNVLLSSNLILIEVYVFKFNIYNFIVNVQFQCKSREDSFMHECNDNPTENEQ